MADQFGAVGPGIAFSLGENVDALFQGEGGSLPSTVILNYVYGVAAYKSWHSKHSDAFDVMSQYREKHYAQIQPLRRPLPDYIRTRGREESDLAKAMDRLSRFVMYLQGITPEEAAERRQKKIEEEERVAQEASRSKVIEWRRHLDAH
jgi:hypothetical protein